MNCIYIRQPEALGLGHAVLCAESVVGDVPFAVLLADDLLDSLGESPVMRQMSEVYNYHRCSVLGVMNVPREQTRQYGIVSTESYIDTNGLPYRFTDLYAKISINGSNGSKFNVFGFNFNDKVNYRQVSDLHWAESGAGSNFVLIPNNSSVLVKGNFAFSKYGISLTQADQQERKSDINGFNLGLDFTYFYGKNDLTYGVEILGYRTNFVFYNSLNRKLSQLDNTTEIGGFLKSKLVVGKLLVEPSFRLHYYASLPVFSPEPRLGLKYNASDKFRIKFAGGMCTQNLMSAASDRDVVN